MPRHDRKRWWEPKPPPPKPKYYGIVSDVWFTGEYVPSGRGTLFRPVMKTIYIAAPYHKHVTHYLDQKFTKEEAEALCKILNAAEE